MASIIWHVLLRVLLRLLLALYFVASLLAIIHSSKEMQLS